jgi:hypothetical protein
MPKTLSSKAIAEQFIQDQFAIMRKYGSEPKLSAARYRALLLSTEKSFNSLRAEEVAFATAPEGGRGHSGNRPIKQQPPTALVRSKRGR